MGEAAAIMEMENPEDSDEEVTRIIEKCGGKDDDYERHQKYKRFYKLAKQTDYNLDCYPRHWVGKRAIAKTLSKEFNKKFYNNVMGAIDFAIHHISSKTGKTYEFVHVSHVAETPNLTLLLTFTAREFDGADADAPVKTLQAMVYYPGFEDPEIADWRFKPAPAAITVG